MNFLKKPTVAVILTAGIVLCSTLVSVNTKLEDKCRDVNAIFYDGVTISGQDYPAMAAPIKELCAITDDILLISGNYGIDTEELSSALSDLELAIQYSDDDINYLGYCYDDFLSALRSVETKLQNTGLSDRHIAALADYSLQVADCVATVEEGAVGYNEYVRSFLRSYDKFPTDMWAELTGIWFPGYFNA